MLGPREAGAHSNTHAKLVIESCRPTVFDPGLGHGKNRTQSFEQIGLLESLGTRRHSVRARSMSFK